MWAGRLGGEIHAAPPGVRGAARRRRPRLYVSGGSASQRGRPSRASPRRRTALAGGHSSAETCQRRCARSPASRRASRAGGGPSRARRPPGSGAGGPSTSRGGGAGVEAGRRGSCRTAAVTRPSLRADGDVGRAAGRGPLLEPHEHSIHRRVEGDDPPIPWAKIPKLRVVVPPR